MDSSKITCPHCGIEIDIIAQIPTKAEQNCCQSRNRVLTLDEVKSLESSRCVWCECKNGHQYGVVGNYIRYLIFHVSRFTEENYGCEWRVWSSQPTYEERLEVAWGE